MSVTSETSLIEYEGNASDSTAYAVPFKFFANAHLRVTVTDALGVATVLDLGSDYQVTGANNPSGGEVVTSIAYDDTNTIRIERVMPLTQPFVYEEGGRLPMKTLEKNFDWLLFTIQWLWNYLIAGLSERPTLAEVEELIVGAEFTPALYVFSISEAGDLILTYEGETPDFSINNDGELIYTF